MMTTRPTRQEDTFEGRIAVVRAVLRTATPGIDRDNLLIELGVLVATQELTNPTIGLAHAIMVAQRTATCIPTEPDHLGDIALADVPDITKIARYGVAPAFMIRDMLADGTIRKVMLNDMVYGYLAVSDGIVFTQGADQECKFCGKTFATLDELRRHQDVPGAACETQYEQLYGGSDA